MNEFDKLAGENLQPSDITRRHKRDIVLILIIAIVAGTSPDLPSGFKLFGASLPPIMVGVGLSLWLAYSAVMFQRAYKRDVGAWISKFEACPPGVKLRHLKADPVDTHTKEDFIAGSDSSSLFATEAGLHKGNIVVVRAFITVKEEDLSAPATLNWTPRKNVYIYLIKPKTINRIVSGETRVNDSTWRALRHQYNAFEKEEWYLSIVAGLLALFAIANLFLNIARFPYFSLG